MRITKSKRLGRLKRRSMWVPGYIYEFKRHDIAERAMLSDMVRIRYCRRLRYLFT
jgi:hypothetical protein